MEAPLNYFRKKPTLSQRLEASTFWAFRIATYLVLIFTAYIVLTIAIKGAPQLFRPGFLTMSPETLYLFDSGGQHLEMGDAEFREYRRTHEVDESSIKSIAQSAGGILPCLVGTVLLVIGSMIIALILGISSAIYLSEYAGTSAWVRLTRLAILNLAGVPSIVFGLFGFGMFVLYFDWGVSLMAGWFTLALMVLPVIITASEESLRSVPRGFREGSLALGATQWQAIRTNVLPYAMPGILTSSILSMARVAGETAPIMFTAAFVLRDELPWQGLSKWTDFFFQGVMALPYHIYVVSSKIPQNEYTERVQYGTAFVFLLVVASVALTAIILRGRLRKRYKW